jgi:hypothetical protein
MNMTELDYSLPKPLDELPIEESHYATVEDAIPPGQSPNPPHVDDEIGGGGAGGDAGEPIYAQVRKKMFRNKWKNESIEESDRVEEPDQIEETNFDDFSDQVSNVKENIIEEIELDDMDGANIGEYFPEESFADPGIPVEANVTIRVPSNYTDVNIWSGSSTRSDSSILSFFHLFLNIFFLTWAYIGSPASPPAPPPLMPLADVIMDIRRCLS